MSDSTIIRHFIREYLVEVCGGLDADVEEIIQTAELAHLHDTRRSSGAPAITHPEAVAKIVNKYYAGRNDLCFAAYLHDAKEDIEKSGNMSQDELESMIRGAIHDHEQGENVLSLIAALTHDKTKFSYDEYFSSILNNDDALIIKLADMLHNLIDEPTTGQALKYKGVVDQLRKKPDPINSSHWAALNQALNKALGQNEDVE